MKNDKNNGSPTATVAKPTPAPAKVEQKPTITTPAPKPEPNPLQERVEKISALQKKWEHLRKYKETQENLNDFMLGGSRREDNLTIEDGSGNEFQTTNPEIIGKVITLLKNEVATLILHTEAEMLTATL